MSKLSTLQIVLGAVDCALGRLAARSDNALTPEVLPDIAAEIAADPAVLHATNAEPWYASRVTWGAIIAALAPILGLALGRTVGAADQAALTEIVSAGGSLLGAALALYGRWVARVPIGSR